MASDELGLRVSERVRKAELLHALFGDRSERIGAHEVEGIRVHKVVLVRVDDNHTVGVGGVEVLHGGVDKHHAKTCMFRASVRQPLRPREWRVDADQLGPMKKRELAHDGTRHLMRAGTSQGDRGKCIELHNNRHARHGAYGSDSATKTHRAHRVKVLWASRILYIDRRAQRTAASPQPDGQRQR